MQADSDTIRDFVRRTDALAHHLGAKLDDLPGFLGFSRPSLFGYRNGTRKISAKALLSLEQAEREAEIRTASSAASRASTRRLAQAAEAAGATEAEKQALFEEWVDKEKMPMVEELLHLRGEVKRLRGILDRVRSALGEDVPDDA